MKSFPIVIPDSHGGTTVIGRIELQDDVAKRMAKVAIQTKEGFVLNPTIDVDKREILEVRISNPIAGKKG